jgi:hypothetical protein
MRIQREKSLTDVSARRPKDVVIEQPTVHLGPLEVEGTSNLIQNCFSQKAVEQMLKKHMGITVQKADTGRAGGSGRRWC